MASTSGARVTLSRLRERAGVRARALRASSTDAERRLWSKLRDRRLDGFKFRRQFPVGPFIADFACVDAHLVIEVDGGQHYGAEGEEADGRRAAFFAGQGYATIRFSNAEVLNNIDGVLVAVTERLAALGPHPNPLPQAGEGARQEGASS